METIIYLLVLTLFGFSYSYDLTAHELKCEYLKEPLAIDRPNLRLSWILKEVDPQKQNLSQTAYQILVASNKNLLANNSADLWDSNKVVSNRSVHIKYNGVALKSKQRSYWKVRVWDQKDSVSDYSSVSKWEMGLIAKNDWSAKWIGAPAGLQQNATKDVSPIDAEVIKQLSSLKPALYLRKTFKANTSSAVKEARLYITSRGAYRAYINGQSIDDSYFNPGWTNYEKTLQYQAYDVTHLIGSNDAVGVILGTGWYSGYIGFRDQSLLYGSEQSVLVELHIEYANNQTASFVSDKSWRVTTGPIVYSDMLMGELYYENRSLHGWLFPSYDDSHWPSVVETTISPNVALIADRSEPIRVTEELSPKNRTEITPGVYVFDFGQNMVGWVQLRIGADRKFLKNTNRIQIRHAEILYPNGSLYTLNLRSARAIDTFVFDSQAINDSDSNYPFVFEPHFTFHGFRYVEITGYVGEPQLTDIVGRVAHSDTPINGKFESSNEMVNQLSRNIVWGQRGNFFSVPTDCPQRDERLGWMGDAEIFAQTATFNADVAPFYTKWLRDVRDGQSAAGGYSDVAPRIVDDSDGAPAWGDAGVIVPYTVWRMYDDIDIVESNYEAMAKWIEYIESVNADNLWRNRLNNNFGDWLQINASTPNDVLSTAYYAYDVMLLSKMALALNKTQDSLKYQSLFAKISEAFNKAFVNSSNARITGDTQTVYLLALAFDLLSEPLRPLAAQHLVDNIRANNWHLTTGFVGVGYLCPVLTRFGHNDVAYRLLLTDTFPSWGYSIKYGATTIWERWDGWTVEKGFQDPHMNSFNHYSLGSVGQWLYRYVAGIDTDSNGLGFSKIIIKPNPGQGLTSVTASYNSIRGQIKSKWKISGTQFSLNTTIPANTRAVVDLSFANKEDVFEIGSGSYEFKVNYTP